MPALTDRNFFLIAVVLYGVSALYSVFLWRKGFQRDDLSNYGLLLAAFAFHLTAMIKRPGDPRSRGGWVWVVHTVATGVLMYCMVS